MSVVTTADGLALFVHEIGPAHAPPLVLVHGGPAASHEYLLPAFATLADTRRLVLYDQRGGGRSEAPADADLTFARHLDDLAAIIDARGDGDGRADVCGYSFGGLIAMVFAVRHPERVRRLVLASSAPPSHRHTGRVDKALAEAQSSPWVTSEREALERSGLRETMPAEYRRRRFSLSVAGYFADPRLCYALTPFLMHMRAAKAVRDSLGAYDFSDELTALDPARTLFVHGALDPIPADVLAETAARAGARFERLAGSGHVPYVEAPQPFFSILRGFLGEADG